jgi:hypothetical protein
MSPNIETLQQLHHLKRDLGPNPASKPKLKLKSKSPSIHKPVVKSSSPVKPSSAPVKPSIPSPPVPKTTDNKTMKKALKTLYKNILKNPKKYTREHKWIAPENAKGIKYITYLGSTGYADASKGYIRSLV